MDTDLSRVIKSKNYLTASKVQVIMYQIVSGIKFMHSANVINRDIKPANILMNVTSGNVKIADFGYGSIFPFFHAVLTFFYIIS